MYNVLKAFRHGPRIFEPGYLLDGDILNHFESERLQELLENGTLESNEKHSVSYQPVYGYDDEE